VELVVSSFVVDASLSLSGVSSDDFSSSEVEVWEFDLKSVYCFSSSGLSASSDGSVISSDDVAHLSTSSVSLDDVCGSSNFDCSSHLSLSPDDVSPDSSVVSLDDSSTSHLSGP